MGFFTEPAHVVITGANRGYGKALALAVIENVKPGSWLTLHSRTGAIPWLEQTDIRGDITIQEISGELQDDVKWYEKLNVAEGTFGEAILFNNAGTCGDVTNTIANSTFTMNYLTKFFAENVGQFVPLARSFFQIYGNNFIRQYF